jgi:hypothetical protein
MTWGQLPTHVRRPRKPGGNDEDHGEDHVAQDAWRTTTMPVVPLRSVQ